METIDEKEIKDETLDLSSEAEENKEVKPEEKTVPLQALQEERRKRQELEQRLTNLEASFKPSSTSEDSNPDLEDAISKLEPYLRKKGFLTKDQLDEEKSANAYAEEMKDLAGKYDGKDGRPVFDAYEVSDFGKKNRIYNLEVAYEQMHKKELLDWTMKKGGNETDTPETEKGGTSGYQETGNTSLLSRESLKARLAKPDGKEWWNKNHDKIIAAMEKGEIS
jgi:hypothetical protein